MVLAFIPHSIKSAIAWSSLGWVDFLLFAVFFLGVLYGVRKGLSGILPILIAVMTAQVVVIEYTAQLTGFLVQRFPIPHWPVQIVIFAALAIASIVFVRFLFKFLSLIASVTFKQPINSLVGALIGGLACVLFLTLLSEFIMMFNIPFIQESFTVKSLTGPYLVETCEQVHYFFERWIPDSAQV